MIPLTLEEIAALLQGTLTDADPRAVVTAVVHDSREVTPGALFVALPGERSDGARFVADAVAAGAVAALTSVSGDGPRLVVPDPAEALRALAAEVRGRSAARVVAITGSAGKTLTKDFTIAAVGAQCEAIANRGNLNNEIGVPLTVCRLEPQTEVLVAEVGARGVGHIATLTPILAPDVSVVINVGEAHLGEYGSIETTARAKRELVEGLREGGIAVLNADDDRVAAMASAAPETVTFGRDASATYRIESVELDERAVARITVGHPAGRVSCRLPVSGEHLASNAAAALAVCGVLGLDVEAAARAIETAPTTGGRMRQVEAGSWLVLDDAYNASPDSMRAALRTLAHIGRSRPTWAVVGKMAELGDATLEAHDAIGRLATRLGIRHLVAVGADAQAVARAAVLEGMLPEDVHAVASIEDAVAVLREWAEADAAILVKASRSAGLDAVVAALLDGREVPA